jgi:CDP-6-deoxy-D-xylo-4-hexulose-3-dehydrase
VADYYTEAFGQPKEFVPGESRLSYAGRVFDASEITSLVDASLDFWLTYGRFSKQFEDKFAKFVGVPYAYLVNSGSSASLLAFSVLTADSLGDRRIDRGDEVITVAAGFPTTISPILQYGAVPVFVDVTLETANIDVSYLEEALSPRSKAVMLAHTLGNPFDLDAVRSFCDKHGLWLIEDNCDALGSTYKGALTGTFGDLATCSFYPPHHMTMGEGGAVCSSDAKLAKIALSMRDWGRDCVCPSGVDNVCGRRFSQDFGTLPHGYDHKYVYSHFGYNLKATEMQAAIGVAQLDKLDSFTDARRRNWAILREGLKGTDDVLVLPVATEGSDPSWFGFLMSVRDGAGVSRDEIVAKLEASGIQTRMLFAGNMVRQPCFDELRASGSGYRAVGDMTATDKIMADGFWVGVYPGFTDEMLQYMIENIRSACGMRSTA